MTTEHTSSNIFILIDFTLLTIKLLYNFTIKLLYKFTIKLIYKLWNLSLHTQKKK